MSSKVVNWFCDSFQVVGLPLHSSFLCPYLQKEAHLSLSPFYGVIPEGPSSADLSSKAPPPKTPITQGGGLHQYSSTTVPFRLSSFLSLLLLLSGLGATILTSLHRGGTSERFLKSSCDKCWLYCTLHHVRIETLIWSKATGNKQKLLITSAIRES